MPTIRKWNIGVDVVSVSRLRKHPVELHRQFYRKVFHPMELKYCMGYADPYPHLAGTFAAKEAVFKAVNLFGQARLQNIMIDRSSASGQPDVKLLQFHPKSSLLEGVNDLEVSVSISHDGDVALAFSLALIKGTQLSTREILKHATIAASSLFFPFQ